MPAWLWNSDNATALVLGVAALATAWSSYQASVWGGVQAAQYTLSSALNAKASAASEQAQRLRLVDVLLFTQWLRAYADEKPRLVAFYPKHFRPEFRAAFDAWVRDSTNRESSTPFERDEYHSAQQLQAESLAATGARELARGQRANELSDHYVFATVMFASVLFFAGAIRPLVSPHLRGYMLSLAALLCVLALVRVVTTPVAR